VLSDWAGRVSAFDEYSLHQQFLKIEIASWGTWHVLSWHIGHAVDAADFLGKVAREKYIWNLLLRVQMTDAS